MFVFIICFVLVVGLFCDLFFSVFCFVLIFLFSKSHSELPVNFDYDCFYVVFKRNPL